MLVNLFVKLGRAQTKLGSLRQQVLDRYS